MVLTSHYRHSYPNHHHTNVKSILIFHEPCMVISCFDSDMVKGMYVCVNVVMRRKYPIHSLYYRQRALFNVLRAFSGFDKEVGYCQGMTNIAAMLLMYCEEEVTSRCSCYAIVQPPLILFFYSEHTLHLCTCFSVMDCMISLCQDSLHSWKASLSRSDSWNDT